MNDKLFMKNNMSWCAAYNCSYLSEKRVHQKNMDICFKPKRGHFCEKLAQ